MKSKTLISLALAVAMLMLSACGGSTNTASSSQSASASSAAGTAQQSGAEEPQELITITLPTYKAGENTGAIFFGPQVERFNQKYEGRYHIEIEQVPQESYNDKMKQLAQQKMLPVLVEGGDRPWVESFVIPNQISYDLGPWLEAHPEVKNVLIDESLAYSTVDGRVVGMPIAVLRAVGLYYNSSMYQPGKNIKDMSFDEFVESLGPDNKIALATGGPAFFTQLLFSAIIANEPGGAEMLAEGFKNKIMDYNTPIWINAADKLQKIARSNGADNIVSAAGPDAMNYFLSKKASVIPNGPWFAAEFNPENANKWSNGFDGTEVVADIYPGNVVIANPQVTSWWIPADGDEKEIEAALAFLEFIYSKEELEAFILAEGGTAPNLAHSDDFINEQSKNPILSKLNGSVDQNTILAPQLAEVMPPSLSGEELGKIVIKLYDGSMTPEQFCAALTEKAALSNQ